MGLLSFLDEPRSRKKKRRRSAWIEHEHRYMTTYTAHHACVGLRREGFTCKIVKLPNGTYAGPARGFVRAP
jgi:hypothetical protein